MINSFCSLRRSITGLAPQSCYAPISVLIKRQSSEKSWQELCCTINHKRYLSFLELGSSFIVWNSSNILFKMNFCVSLNKRTHTGLDRYEGEHDKRRTEFIFEFCTWLRFGRFRRFDYQGTCNRITWFLKCFVSNIDVNLLLGTIEK